LLRPNTIAFFKPRKADGRWRPIRWRVARREHNACGTARRAADEPKPHRRNKDGSVAFDKYGPTSLDTHRFVKETRK